MTNYNIPSAGPWITDKEVDYVSDACRNGWYENWHNYLDRFEEAFSQYTGNQYVLPTSSCTGALHLAMSAIGIGPGDEVIVPETTWIATASCVCYVGAKPVFVDVERDTWCLDPQKFKEAITPKTKAVIPVHMYGHPADMNTINSIAKENNIIVIEDAAPGIGSQYDGKPAGSFGLGACFSFQGAKPLVMGEGGALVTNDKEFFDKAYHFWDHGRAQGKVLFNDIIGYKYKMTNIQAALGLAQIERGNEIIEKRRQIFFWYRDRLGDIEGLRLNAERENVTNNFYVPTIVLDKQFSVNASQLMDTLTEKGIGNRPFFRCISKFPMFEPAETPEADFLAENGINLPCATMMTEDQVDIVSKCIRSELLK